MTNNKVINQSLYNWIFHYNPWTDMWNAFPREKHNDYFNDPYDSSMVVIRSSKIETLISLLYRIDGDPEKLDNL